MGSGAPEGNRNALKHGRHSAEALALRQWAAGMVREARKLVQKVG
jgi:hypothetical protein